MGKWYQFVSNWKKIVDEIAAKKKDLLMHGRNDIYASLDEHQPGDTVKASYGFPLASRRWNTCCVVLMWKWKRSAGTTTSA